MEKKDKKNIPKHVAIILDGNRRWAKERNLPIYDGYLNGYEKMLLVPDWFFSRGVEIVSFFAFSTRNWSRSREEINYLMKLLKKAFDEKLDVFMEKGYKFVFSGRIDELPGDLPDTIKNAIAKTGANKKGIVNICLNYGGRAEIVDAIKKMLSNGVKVDQIHKGMIRKYLYNGGISDPDMIVRTSGEKRLSGFMLWQSAYSEILFLKKYWPDFEELDIKNILEDYNRRERRFEGDVDDKK